MSQPIMYEKKLLTVTPKTKKDVIIAIRAVLKDVCNIDCYDYIAENIYNKLQNKGIYFNNKIEVLVKESILNFEK